MEDNSELENKLVVAAAIASVDFAGKRQTDVESDILKRVDFIKRMMGDNSVAMLMLDSVHIYCTIKSIEYEETSTRYVVSFVADNDENGKVETIRTDRTDGNAGHLVRALWTQDLVGKHVCLYKHNDVPSADSANEIRKRGGTIPPQGYRRAVYVRIAPQRTNK
jgi:hypothetical protein